VTLVINPTVGCHGATQNARPKNDGQSREENRGLEKEGLENDGLENDGLCYVSCNAFLTPKI